MADGAGGVGEGRTARAADQLRQAERAGPAAPAPPGKGPADAAPGAPGALPARRPVSRAVQAGARQAARGAEQATRTTGAARQGPTAGAGPRPAQGLARPAAGPDVAAPAREAPAAPARSLRLGNQGRDVQALQRQLAAHGQPVNRDGKFTAQTDRAVRAYQQAHHLQVDGIAGPRTRASLERGAGAVGPGEAPRPGTPPAPSAAPTSTSPPGRAGTDGTATFDSVSNRGARNQMVSGKITVNGHSYDFKSGGSGRGNLPPGDYTVSNHRANRDTPGMVKDGVGFSFDLSDKQDPRNGGATRSLLRIHPDGGRAGTIGCIGIQGNAATQRRFEADMKAELARHGGRYTLRVG